MTTASSAASKLRTLAHKSLTEEECSSLKASIRRFRENQSVLGLCIALKKIIDSPDKIHLLPYINAMIPTHLQGDFEKLCKLQFQCYKPHMNIFPTDVLLSKKQADAKRKSCASRLEGVQQQRPIEEYANIKNTHRRSLKTVEDCDAFTCIFSRRKTSSGSAETKHVLHKRSKTYHAPGTGRNLSGIVPMEEDDLKRELIKELSARNSLMNVVQMTNGHVEKDKSKVIRRIVLTRRDGQSLGFSIRGGKDLNAGIFISEVDRGGQAEKKGLKVGERILKVNDQIFDDVTHAQAVVCLKSTHQLTMFVAPLGQMPGGTPDSTPRSTCSSGTSAHSECSKKSVTKTESDNSPKKITVMADEDGWLGFSIRGGVDQGIEPCIAHVDPQSPAWRAGLIRGMKINKVNETPVAGMKHLDMVQLVTVTRVVVLHLTQGKPEQRRSMSGKARDGSSQGSSSTPAVKDSDEKESFFLKDLEFTPPMHSSTPLPPAGHPPSAYNPKTFLRRFTRKPSDPNATIVQVIKEDAKSLPSKSNKKPSRKKVAQQEGVRVEKEMAKLDGGTIKLNLAGKSGTSDQNPGGESLGDKNKLHIKNVFKSSPSDFQNPTAVTNGYPTDATNILSTPVLNHKGMVLSPSSSELRDARFEAARQIRGELTGKHQPIPFTPNVLPAPAEGKQGPSPGTTLSKIFSKVARRSLGEELISSSSGKDKMGGFHNQMDWVGMGTSPYQMIQDHKMVDEHFSFLN